MLADSTHCIKCCFGKMLLYGVAFCLAATAFAAAAAAMSTATVYEASAETSERSTEKFLLQIDYLTWSASIDSPGLC